MYGVLRQYRLDPKNVADVIHRIEEGGVPIIKSIPGFVSYGISDTGNGSFGTLSVYESKEGADASTAKAAEWVRANVVSLLPNPPTVTAGEMPVRVAKALPKYTVARRYTGVDRKNIEPLLQRIRDGFVPIVSALPGFATYSVIDAGDGVIVTLSGFDSRTSAEESVRAAAAYVKKHVASLMPNPPEVTQGEVKVSVRAS
ncbi:MAG TPA: hypothetical protein VIO35_05185 [Chloroflexota bacterium]